MINIYTAVKQSQGDTVRPMLLNVLGVSVNLILDPLFLMKFGWGISGAALATLLAKIPSAVLALYVLTRKGQLIQINFKGFRFEKDKNAFDSENRSSNGRNSVEVQCSLVFC